VVAGTADTLRPFGANRGAVGLTTFAVSPDARPNRSSLKRGEDAETAAALTRATKANNASKRARVVFKWILVKRPVQKCVKRGVLFIVDTFPLSYGSSAAGKSWWSCIETLFNSRGRSRRV